MDAEPSACSMVAPLAPPVTLLGSYMRQLNARRGTLSFAARVRCKSLRARLAMAGALATALLVAGCLNVDTPYTSVALDNDYPASSTTPLVVYEAFWEATAFATPVPPGGSSGTQSTVPASNNTAWAVLAPGWDPSSTEPPSSFVVLQSRAGFGVDLNDTLHIRVDDATFAGNCSAGSFLTQAQADFITQIVFPSTFAGLHYDAATCRTTSSDDGAPE